MKKLILITFALIMVQGFSQKIDSKVLLSGSDLSYYKASEKEIETYLNNPCLQLNAAKRAMVLDYGLLRYADNDGTVKRNIVGLKKVQGWNAVAQIKYNCTERNYYDFTQFFNLKTEHKKEFKPIKTTTK